MEFRGYSGNQVVLYLVGIVVVAALIGGWYAMANAGASEVVSVFAVVLGSYILGWRHGEADRRSRPS